MPRLDAKEIVLTHSEGVLIHAEGKFHHFKFHSESMAGRSGRGRYLRGNLCFQTPSLPPREAGKWAAAVTSLKVERHGVFDRPVSEVEAFIAEHYAD